MGELGRVESKSIESPRYNGLLRRTLLRQIRGINFIVHSPVFSHVFLDAACTEDKNLDLKCGCYKIFTRFE